MHKQDTAGRLVLEGGAEFGGGMRAPDLRALALAGGLDAPVAIVPTAAAPDNNHERAGGNGVRWFRALGATRVEAVGLIDRASAEDEEVVAALREARLIYLLGGFTGYLRDTLADSAAWRAMLAAYREGAVLAGSSAGAMVLCEHMASSGGREVRPGLGLVPNACVLPHHNTFGRTWAEPLGALLPHAVLLGIDERSGMIDDGGKGAWRVYGDGAVTLYREGEVAAYGPGDVLSLDG